MYADPYLYHIVLYLCYSCTVHCVNAIRVPINIVNTTISYPVPYVHTDIAWKYLRIGNDQGALLCFESLLIIHVIMYSEWPCEFSLYLQFYVLVSRLAIENNKTTKSYTGDRF